MTGAPVLRDARPDDAEALGALHVAGARWAYRGIAPDRWLDGLSVAERADSWRERLAGSAAEGLSVVVAERDGAAVGFVAAGASRDADAGPQTGELHSIYLAPEVVGIGLGHALHGRALADLRAGGFAEATLWVVAGNARARRFYERAGWDPDGTVDRSWRPADVTVPVLRYRLALR